jgi:hypothetical protein
MAVPTNTFETYDSVGIREDLADIIFNISPTETPFMSNVGKGSTKGTFHEWQIDALEAATDNKAIEGDDATNDAITPTTRVGNYTQIADKVIQISGSDLKADNAGRASELAYQLAKSGLELKRDMETTLIGTNKGRAAGSSGTARELGSVLSWVATNDSVGATGASPTGNGTDARTDGTQRAFTETLLTDVIDACWESGGNPSIIMTGSFNKRKITGFTGNATKYKEVDDKKVINAVDVYVSDYGELMVVPNRFQRARDCWLLDPDMWSVDFYRDFSTHDLAKTGDSERKQMIVEYTLTSKQEASSGLVADLTTS